MIAKAKSLEFTPSAVGALPLLDGCSSAARVAEEISAELWPLPWQRKRSDAHHAHGLIDVALDLVKRALDSSIVPEEKEALERAWLALCDAEQAVTESSVAWLDAEHPLEEMKYAVIEAASVIHHAK